MPGMRYAMRTQLHQIVKHFRKPRCLFDTFLITSIASLRRRARAWHGCTKIPLEGRSNGKTLLYHAS